MVGWFDIPNILEFSYKFTFTYNDRQFVIHSLIFLGGKTSMASVYYRSKNINNNGERKVLVRTVTASKIPQEMLMAFIQSEYRLANQPLKYYIKSIFKLHNETINIWTQFVGFFLLLVQTIYYFNIYKSRGSSIQVTVSVFGTCCGISLLHSAFAHLLLSMSPSIYYVASMADYMGALLWGYGTVYLSYYGLSTIEIYNLIGPYFMALHVVLTYLNFYNVCFAKPWTLSVVDNCRKIALFIGLFIELFFAYSPLGHRYWKCFRSDTCDVSSLRHITDSCSSFILMSVVYFSKLPERLYPRKFDMFGQSHQIFHFLAIVTQSLQLRSLYIDFVTGENVHCKPNLHNSGLCGIVLYVLCFMTIILFSHSKCYTCKKKLKDQMSSTSIAR